MVFLVSACGGSTAPAGSTVRITERDFHITAPRHVRAGDITLTVRNRGPDDHELIVVRLTRAKLPMRTDGTTVDEDRLDRRTLGALEPGQPQSTRLLRLKLAPGRYVLFCNMSGHFLGGMHATLDVS